MTKAEKRKKIEEITGPSYNNVTPPLYRTSGFADINKSRYIPDAEPLKSAKGKDVKSNDKERGM